MANRLDIVLSGYNGNEMKNQTIKDFAIVQILMDSRYRGIELHTAIDEISDEIDAYFESNR